MSEEDIKQLLHKESNKYGKVSSIMTKIDNKTKKPFAFVCFEEYESATKAFEEFQNLSLDKENKLYVSWSQKKQMRT
jgi:RNA recognition motif-containing protein